MTGGGIVESEKKRENLFFFFFFSFGKGLRTFVFDRDESCLLFYSTCIMDIE